MFIYYFFLAIAALNGTALSGEDFENKTEMFTLAPAESITYEIDILKDKTFEREEETFQLVVLDKDDNLINSTVTVNTTVDISIGIDNRCGEYYVFRTVRSDNG